MNRDGNRYFLFERFQRLDSSHRFRLNETTEKLQYKSILSEQENDSFSSLTEAFINHKKLSGLVREDKKYLKEFYGSLNLTVLVELKKKLLIDKTNLI